MDYLLSALTLFAETMASVYICDALMKRRCFTKMYSFLQLGKFILLFLVLNLCDTISSSAASVVLTWLITFIVISILYQSHVLFKLFVATLTVLCIVLFDVVSMSFFMTLLGFTQQNVLEEPTVWLLGAFVSKTLLFTSGYIFNRLRAEKEAVVKGNVWTWCSIVIIPAFTIFNLDIFVQASLLESNFAPAVFVSALGLFGVQGLLLFLLDKAMKEHQIAMENKVYQQELKNRMRITQAWIDAFEEQRKLTHDFKQHIQIANQLLQSKQIPQAQNYLTQLYDDSLNAAIVQTNNPIIDAVLNQKYALAKRSGVIMRFKLGNLASFPLKPADSVTLLANLLDNAIEAASKVEGDKQIVIKIITSDEKTVLSLRNTSLPVEITDNCIATTKPTAEQHGFGLKNIKAILNSYNFQYAMKYQDNQFLFSAVLS